MSDREDRRYQQAEAKIRDAFMKLMEEKGFESMSATDLIKRACVNRTTFYAHYRDKYDLLDAIESEFWEPLAAYISGNTGNMLTEEFFRQTITEIISYYYEHREMLRLLTRSNNDRYYWDRFFDRFQGLFLRIFEVNQTTVPNEYALSALMGMISGTLTTWVKHDFRESAEEMAEIEFRILSGIPERIFSERG